MQYLGHGYTRNLFVQEDVIRTYGGGGLVANSCPTLATPCTVASPVFSVHGVFQARILEWVAISFSRGSSRPRDRTLIFCVVDRFFTAEAPGKPINIYTHTHTHTHTHIYMKVKVRSLSRVRLFVTPWTVAYQAFPSMGFSRQEYWSGLPFPSPGDLPNPGIEPGSPAL